ncbi:MAG TPA: amidohydrolase family protein [Longimicrobiales bacterium]|nr:amidohydrolase family protein [Longimicrobiales bacterium]
MNNQSAVLLSLLLLPWTAQAQARPPVIDMHLHAYSEAQWTGRPRNPATGQPAPATAAEHLRACLAAMDEYNVVAAVVTGPLDAVSAWRAAAPGRVLASPIFGRPDVDFYGQALPPIAGLRALYRAGQLRAMAEVVAQYEGFSPSDPALDPYFALAEELDVPVGIHTGTSFPRTPYSGRPNFRLALGNPLLLEDLLVRHPNLRVYIMHGGAPWTRETIAVMQMYPQVYMDVAVINWIDGPDGLPRFHQFLREMMAAGLGSRIMFGTDQMRWPEAIASAIRAIETADFLSAGQKRDILYNNAARFLRLSEAEIARHHGK